MKILVACEFSGTIRDMLIAKGHDAISCDLLPTAKPGPHYQGDVFDIINDGFDAMIAHPPCTYLSAAGLHLCGPKNPKSKKRIIDRDEALWFVHRLYNAPINKIVIENPVGWLSTGWRKPDQTIYMNDFGHAEARKPTCLWLKNVPKLVPTNKVELLRGHGNRVSLWFSKTGGGKEGAKKRSVTFEGVGRAIADQMFPIP